MANPKIKHWGYQKGINYGFENTKSMVLNRDNYTCQCCGRRSRVGDKVFLECHHLKPFSKILKDNNILNLEDALKCEELFDIDNGQTLCKKCHKTQIHME